MWAFLVTAPRENPLTLSYPKRWWSCHSILFIPTFFSLPCVSLSHLRFCYTQFFFCVPPCLDPSPPSTFTYSQVFPPFTVYYTSHSTLPQSPPMFPCVSFCLCCLAGSKAAFRPLTTDPARKQQF